MPTMVIKNGSVFDPLNGIDGEVMDVFIKDGKVVRDLSGADLKRAEVIDARGKTVMPGAVDSHAHVAGAKVNAGRLMRPEDHIGSVRQRTKITHSGSGYTVPSVYKQGYDYSVMGYTTVFEAAMPPLEARHTHEEMRSTPMLDMGAYLVLGNNWFLMRYLHQGEIEKAAAYVAWMMKTHKAYGIKCVNPAGVENWGWGKNVHSLDEPNIHFDVTAREVIHGLAEVNEILGMPISLHLHANNLGHPGNAEITKDSLAVPADVSPNPKMGVDWAETAAECHKWGYDRSSLGGVEREMSLFEIAILTRANTARTIGMAHRKGHLGAGADGDVAIYEIDPERFNPDDVEKMIRAFSRAECTIKDGQVVARRGEVVAVPEARRYYCEPKVDEGLARDMMADVKEWFKYYTIGLANYPVPDKHLRNPEPIVVNGPEEVR